MPCLAWLISLFRGSNSNSTSVMMSFALPERQSKEGRQGFRWPHQDSGLPDLPGMAAFATRGDAPSRARVFESRRAVRSKCFQKRPCVLPITGGPADAPRECPPELRRHPNAGGRREGEVAVDLAITRRCRAPGQRWRAPSVHRRRAESLSSSGGDARG